MVNQTRKTPNASGTALWQELFFSSSRSHFPCWWIHLLKTFSTNTHTHQKTAEIDCYKIIDPFNFYQHSENKSNLHHLPKNHPPAHGGSSCTSSTWLFGGNETCRTDVHFDMGRNFCHFLANKLHCKYM